MTKPSARQDHRLGAAGLYCAVGVSGRLTRKRRRHHYAIIGDGESQEGQIWEAAMSRQPHSSITSFAFTTTTTPQHARFSQSQGRPRWTTNGAASLDVAVIDGHDLSQIDAAIAAAKSQDKPTDHRKDDQGKAVVRREQGRRQSHMPFSHGRRRSGGSQKFEVKMAAVKAEVFPPRETDDGAG
jgi:hypothetical protein